MKIRFTFKRINETLTLKDAKYNVFNQNDEHIGFIEYYAPWKHFVLSTVDNGIIFSWDCLLEVSNFLKKLDEEVKNE